MKDITKVIRNGLLSACKTVIGHTNQWRYISTRILTYRGPFLPQFQQFYQPIFSCKNYKRTFHLTLMVSVWVIILCVPLSGRADEKFFPMNSPGSKSPCIQISELSRALLAQKENDRNISGENRALNKAALGPITKKEIRQLIRSMKPVKVKIGQGKRMKDLVIKNKLNKMRMQILLQDATLLLTEIHMRESLDRINRLGGIKKNLRIQIQNRLQISLEAFNICAEARFFHHGGPTALEQSRAIVNQFRVELEDVIIGDRGPGIILPPLDWLHLEGRP